jgi:hypothetical protein
MRFSRFIALMIVPAALATSPALAGDNGDNKRKDDGAQPTQQEKSALERLKEQRKERKQDDRKKDRDKQDRSGN